MSRRSHMCKTVDEVEPGLVSKASRNELQVAVSHYPTYNAINIDFDEASASWHAGKRKRANGCIQYICEMMLSSGRRCSGIVCKESLEDYIADNRTCKRHYIKSDDEDYV